MKKIFLSLAIAATLTNCTDVRTETSELKHEKSTVVTLIYSPSKHETKITRTAYNDLNTNSLLDEDDDFGLSPIVNTGTDYDGNQGIKISKNHQITNTTIPEKYGVVFQCEHGTFTVEGSEQKHRVLYHKLYNSTRDTVDILYKEQYFVTYEEDKATGKKVETKRVLNKLDFIDAQILKK
jgi:hypothetical protein